ncbi:MAG: hypothetical protein M0R30_13365 [Methanoregula sp.]|jgi:hypothetical protein|uniref:hypothetical protein n=1 Tax=Methanoregula sp. TaxID=2052170 RepID=UPI0025F1B12E|nr:hypothetical protein [Methanoregula sp.]MCK9632615.1 hypothetical protein [Methanoregula sp.]
MDRKIPLLLVSGIILTLILFFFINVYAAGIVFILIVTLAMSLFIMQDSGTLPDVVAELREDAKGIIIRNAGNSDAVKVHVALVPVNIEFDITVLAPDQINEYPLEKMIAEVKAVVTFENVMGDAFSRSYKLNADGSGFDPLKPMIPLFRQK